jgi:hypothetical protein
MIVFKCRKKYILVQNAPKIEKFELFWVPAWRRTSGGRQNLFKRNFHFQGQILKFSILKVSPISLCDTSFCSPWRVLKVYRILTLKIYDFDRNFQGQRCKNVLFQSKRPPNRQIWIISSSIIKTNIRRQNLFKRNFHFQGQILQFSIFKVSPISLCDTSFCSSWRELKFSHILTLKIYDLDSIFSDILVG